MHMVGYEQFHYAHCPFVVDDARSGANGLSWILADGTIYPGVLTLYDWNGEGIADHIGCVEVPNADGSFVAIEGNAQPLTSRVLTVRGWKLMGDVVVGDEVIDPAGAPSKVTGVYPKGIRPVYRISFSDGSSVEACDEHLSAGEIGDARRRSFVTTAFMASRFAVGARMSIPALVAPEFQQTEPLPIEPYLLGLLLGDGGFTHDGVKFTSTDGESLAAFTDGIEALGDQLVGDGDSLRAAAPAGAPAPARTSASALLSTEPWSS